MMLPSATKQSYLFCKRFLLEGIYSLSITMVKDLILVHGVLIVPNGTSTFSVLENKKPEMF